MSVDCPDCEGKGTQFVFGIRYAPGHSGPTAKDIPCTRCNGRKVIQEKQLAWIERGRELRRVRVEELQLGLREAADLWGMRASHLSKLESGKIDNSDWSPPADTERTK